MVCTLARMMSLSFTAVYRVGIVGFLAAAAFHCAPVIASSVADLWTVPADTDTRASYRPRSSKRRDSSHQQRDKKTLEAVVVTKRTEDRETWRYSTCEEQYHVFSPRSIVTFLPEVHGTPPVSSSGGKQPLTIATVPALQVQMRLRSTPSLFRRLSKDPHLTDGLSYQYYYQYYYLRLGSHQRNLQQTASNLATSPLPDYILETRCN